MKNHIRDLVTGFVLLAVSAFYYIASLGIRVFSGYGSTPITARTIPQIWAVTIAAVSLILIVRSLKRLHTAKASGEAYSEESYKNRIAHWIKDNYAVIGTFIVLTLYTLSLKNAGFVVSTLIYLFIQVLLLTEKKKINKKLIVKAIIVTVIFSFAADYLFVELLSVPLPRGIWGF